MPTDPEFYNALDRFIEDKVVSMPASYDVAIEALDAKSADLRRKIGRSERVNASDRDTPMNFISREQVLEILKRHGAADIQREVEALFSFPAPNPDWRNTDRNIMGQTEDEFWAAVDK